MKVIKKLIFIIIIFELKCNFSFLIKINENCYLIFSLEFYNYYYFNYKVQIYAFLSSVK